MVSMVFDQEANISRARQSVTERLQQIENQLPPGAHPPEISPLVSPLGTILQYAFTVDQPLESAAENQGQTSLMELCRWVDVILKVRFFRCPVRPRSPYMAGMSVRSKSWLIRRNGDRSTSPSIKLWMQPEGLMLMHRGLLSASALGMLPLALARGAGNEILQPLAIAVLGGLFTSTALALLVIPALYARFCRWFIPKALEPAIDNGLAK